VQNFMLLILNGVYSAGSGSSTHWIQQMTSMCSSVCLLDQGACVGWLNSGRHSECIDRVSSAIEGIQIFEMLSGHLGFAVNGSQTDHGTACERLR
jgi:hypothetical protein